MIGLRWPAEIYSRTRVDADTSPSNPPTDVPFSRSADRLIVVGHRFRSLARNRSLQKKSHRLGLAATRLSQTPRAPKRTLFDTSQNETAEFQQSFIYCNQLKRAL